jgi:hypothetical protein
MPPSDVPSLLRRLALCVDPGAERPGHAFQALIFGPLPSPPVDPLLVVWELAQLGMDGDARRAGECIASLRDHSILQVLFRLRLAVHRSSCGAGLDVATSRVPALGVAGWPEELVPVERSQQLQQQQQQLSPPLHVDFGLQVALGYSEPPANARRIPSCLCGQGLRALEDLARSAHPSRTRAHFGAQLLLAVDAMRAELASFAPRSVADFNRLCEGPLKTIQAMCVGLARAASAPDAKVRVAPPPRRHLLVANKAHPPAHTRTQTFLDRLETATKSPNAPSELEVLFQAASGPCVEEVLAFLHDPAELAPGDFTSASEQVVTQLPEFLGGCAMQSELNASRAFLREFRSVACAQKPSALWRAAPVDWLHDLLEANLRASMDHFRPQAQQLHADLSRAMLCQGHAKDLGPWSGWERPLPRLLLDQEGFTQLRQAAELARRLASAADLTSRRVLQANKQSAALKEGVRAHEQNHLLRGLLGYLLDGLAFDAFPRLEAAIRSARTPLELQSAFGKFAHAVAELAFHAPDARLLLGSVSKLAAGVEAGAPFEDFAKARKFLLRAGKGTPWLQAIDWNGFY